MKWWVCVVEYTANGDMEVPRNACIRDNYITDDTGDAWPIWMEEPSDETKAHVLSPTRGRIWYLVEVEYDYKP